MSKNDVVPPCQQTPDGRYMVVRGRLWRLSNPALDSRTRQLWVDKLMAARRELKVFRDVPVRTRHARDAVNEAKIALGERGLVWWDDGAPDYNRHLVVNTPYASWFEAIESCCLAK